MMKTQIWLFSRELWRLQYALCFFQVINLSEKRHDICRLNSKVEFISFQYEINCVTFWKSSNLKVAETICILHNL